MKLQGTRDTVTWKEYNNCFIHPHCNSNYPGEWGDICTGFTDLSTAIANMKYNFDTENFVYILSNLEEFLSWESLDGKPFSGKEISNILNQTVITNANFRAEVEIGEKEVFEKQIVPKIKQEITASGAYFTIDRDNIEEIIEKNPNIKKYYTSKGMIVNDNVVSDKYALKAANEKVKNYSFVFKGKIIVPKVIEDKESLTIIQKRVDPAVTNKITENINKQFLIHQIIEDEKI